MNAPQIVQKLWNYCDLLLNDGLSYGDYVEQLTFLLFLKMANERGELGESRIVPKGYDWPILVKEQGEALEARYRDILAHLASRPGMLGLVFRKSQNKIQDPAKLTMLTGGRLRMVRPETFLSVGRSMPSCAGTGRRAATSSTPRSTAKVDVGVEGRDWTTATIRELPGNGSCRSWSSRASRRSPCLQCGIASPRTSLSPMSRT
jgi:hypothetical protein